MRPGRARLRAGCAGAWRRVRSGAWPIAQQTAAATLAWVIAKLFGPHGDPFFAPIAAVVALNTARGRRGVNAVQLLAGVVMGIGFGELTVLALGGGYGTLALAVFGSMVLARAVTESGLVVAQSAASAILTVTAAGGQAGPFRIVDALIGAGVALVFSQLLFTPEPLALLRRAESAALDGMADGLDRAVRALREDDDPLREEALSRLREQRDRLADLARMAEASTSVPRYSLVWRTRRAATVRESAAAARLDLLGGSAVLVARTALTAGPEQRRALVPAVADLAAILRDLAADPGGHAVRRRAADGAVALAARAGDPDLESVASGRDAAAALRMAAVDVLVFAGVDAAEARAVVRGGAVRYDVPAPPGAVRLPRLLRRLVPRRPRRDGRDRVRRGR
ncbi:FUSC family protein [Actinomadura geliboluensis]